MTEADSVQSRDDLANYLVELADRVRRGDLVAENLTAADLIEATGHWIRDMDGYYLGLGSQVPTTPHWGTIADMFTAGLIYE